MIQNQHIAPALRLGNASGFSDLVVTKVIPGVTLAYPLRFWLPSVLFFVLSWQPRDIGKNSHSRFL